MKNNYCKKYFIAICLTLFAALVMAQQDAESKKEESSKEKMEQPAAKTVTTNNTKSSNKDTFVPSESISEDLSVSFPVDI